MKKRVVSLRWRWAALAGALPLAVGMVTFQSAIAPVLAGAQPNKIQSRLLDGTAEMALGLLPTSPTSLSNYVVQDPPSDYIPGPNGECPVNYGPNVKVNQSCLNVSTPALQGRGQAQDETAIAVNPNNPNDLLAATNDYTYGDGLAGGTAFSTDGGRTWQDSQVPLEFTNGSDFGNCPGLTQPCARMYWQGGGDPSVAWDTHGNAYFAGLHFNRGFPTSDNPDASSGVYVYRSTQNDGASWSMPGTPVVTAFNPTGANSGLPLDDKPYMTIDDGHNAYTNRIFVTWTLFAADGTAYIYGAYSSDSGRTFSTPVVVSTNSVTLCPYTFANFGITTPQGNCNENQFSDPFFGPDGSLYVAYDNYNTVAETPGTTTGFSDNHYQVLLSKSTDGGATFGAPVLVGDYNDLPDCADNQAGQDAGRECVPEKGSAVNSVFRATNYPSGGVDPANGSVVITFGSYINADSNPSNGCTPIGFSPNLNPDYAGVKTVGACNNKILESTSSNGGASFQGTVTDPTTLTIVSSGGAQKLTDQWWQWAAFTPNGTLAVSYYDRQYGSDETTGQMDVTLSTSGQAARGQSDGHGSQDLTNFSETRATSSSMPLPTQFPDTQGNSLFFGDYSGLTVSARQANPLWTDTRDLDLFDCAAVGGPASPPQVCTAREPNGIVANDQAPFTVSLPVRPGPPGPPGGH
jgi:hypothetical protein